MEPKATTETIRDRIKIDPKAVLEVALAGYDTPVAAAKKLFSPPEGLQVARWAIAEIARILKSAEFNKEYQRAKEDMLGTAINSIRQTVMDNVLEVKKLAKEATDPRVKLSANKDLLDRAGLAPAQKSVAYSPTDYLRLIEGLAPSNEGENRLESTEDQPKPEDKPE